MILYEKLAGKRVVLASASPRRQMLMVAMGIPFEVIVFDIEEVCPGKLPPEETAVCLAAMKAACYRFEPDDTNTILIAADTIVVLDGEIINKPEDEEDAIRLLSMLSGNMHEVHTGVSMVSHDKVVNFCDTTKVWFRSLSHQEIAYYVRQFKPMDKAGAYGVQEWIGYIGVERMEGSFYNVMGFPTHKVYEELFKF